MAGTERDRAGVTEQNASAAVSALSSVSVDLRAGDADVGQSREVQRRRRLRTSAWWMGIPAAYLWFRILSGNPIEWGLPSIDPMLAIPILFFVSFIAVLVGTTVGAGRSPHVMYRPDQIMTKLDDVKGIDPVKDEVVRSLNLFLAHKTFANDMGGTPRRGILFEGSPGTGNLLGQGDGSRSWSALPVRVGDLVSIDVLRGDGAQDPLILQAAAQSGPF